MRKHQPLKLSPDYVPLKEQILPVSSFEKPVSRLRSKDGVNSTKRAALSLGKSKQFFYGMQDTNPSKYRFIRLYGRGDMVAGYGFYNEYCDRLTKETISIIRSLSARRLKSAFALFIDIDSTILSQSKRSQAVNKTRILTMKKIVNGIDPFIEFLKS